MRLQAGNQQQIDNFNGTVRATDADRWAGRRNGEHLGMFDWEDPAIGQMNVERPEWTRTVHFLQLFNGHGK